MAENEKKETTETTEEKEEKPEEKERQRKKEEEDPDIAALKNTIRKLRGVAVIALLFSLAGILLCRFAGSFTDVSFAIKGFLWVLFFISVLGWYATYAVKLVKEFETATVVRFDKFRSVLESGLRVILWPFDKITFVDMREQEIDIPEQDVITKDNVVVKVDGLLNIKIFDPYKSLFNVKNPFQMLSNLGQTNIRNQIGELTLDKAFAERAELGDKVADFLNIDAGNVDEDEHEIIKSRMDENYTDEEKRKRGWGVKVTRARVKKIDPPDDIKKAMHLQATAEREKRAIKLHAEAKKYEERTIAKGRAIGYKALLEELKKDGSLDVLVQLESLLALKKGMDGKATKVFLPSDPLLAAITKIAEATREKTLPDESTVEATK